MLIDLSDSNKVLTHNHLAHKWTLSHLAKLTFRQTFECRFTLKLVRDMIITYSLIDLVKKIIFPCFIEFMLYFYHLFVVCYYFLFNQRILNIVWRNPFASDRIFFFWQKMIKISLTFPFTLLLYTFFVCYKLFCKLCKITAPLNDNSHKILHRYDFL